MIVLRAVMIGFGAAVIAQVSWILTVLALFLIGTGVKMLVVSDKAATSPAIRCCGSCGGGSTSRTSTMVSASS